MRTWCLIVLTLIVSTSTGFAKSKPKVNPYRGYKKIVIPVDTVTPKITQDEINQFVPVGVTHDTKTNEVMAKIADRGFQFWYKKSIKDTALGQAVETAQGKLKADVELPAESDDEVSHKFSFKIEAFQGLAMFEYTGWLNAAINYDSSSTQTDIQIRELLFDNKNLYVNHRIGSNEQTSSVGLSWNW